MIAISTTTALMLYLMLSLSFIFLLWGYHHTLSKKKKVILSKDKLHVCEFCHFAYLANRAKSVTRCPECKSFNKDIKNKKPF